MQVLTQLFRPAAFYVLVVALAAPARAQPGDGPQLQISNWSLTCESRPEAAALLCEMTQTMSLAGSGQTFATLFVTPQDGPFGTFHALRLQLPHGVDVREPFEVWVDGAPAATPEIRTSGLGGLFARTELTPDLIGKMRQGDKTTVAFATLTGQRISGTVPLEGFATLYDGMP